jgi:hypothetical protein
MLRNRTDAYRLLRELGAPERLLLHLQLVGEAAEQLVSMYGALGIEFNASLIELGVAVHDAGKIEYPEELDGPGSRHEPAGEILLLANGVQPEVARCCVSHAAWQGAGVSFEERSVALADKLWKGKREEALELRIIDDVASRLGVGRWEMFAQLDSIFEEIAGGGIARLERSRGA